MVLVQNWPFSTFFLGNIEQTTVSYDILQRKNNVLGYKKRSLKSRKIDLFLKVLVHGFGPKLAIFPIFFFGNIEEETVFCDILKRKKTTF